jgi:alkaline phosphatase
MNRSLALRLTSFVFVFAATASASPISEAPKSSSKPKSVILLIGDGMGPQQLGLLELYSRHELKSESPFRKLSRTAEMALVSPSASGALVVDSACSASALASGVESLPGTLGIDASGATVESILERAKKAGKSVGLVSDTRITHATPAAFIAHVVDRDDEYAIARQIAESKADVLLSGGAKFFSETGERKDAAPASETATARGFTLLTDKAQLAELSNGHGKRFLGLFAKSAMEDALTLKGKSSANSKEPSLLDMSRAAIGHLSQNPNGFFLMIEAGQIDWAGHANDAGWLLAEMLRMAEVVDFVTDWRTKNPETLVLVTADHETGGFGFSYSAASIPAPFELPNLNAPDKQYAADYNFVAPQILKRLAQQKTPVTQVLRRFSGAGRTKPDAAARLQRSLLEVTGYEISNAEAQTLLLREKNQHFVPSHKDLNEQEVPKLADFSAFYPKPVERASAELARLLSDRTGIVWASGTHTSTPVPLFAVGPGQSAFRGLADQYEVGHRLLELFLPDSRKNPAK